MGHLDGHDDGRRMLIAIRKLLKNCNSRLNLQGLLLLHQVFAIIIPHDRDSLLIFFLLSHTT